METVARVTTAPLASLTVPEMRPPTPARAPKASMNRAARSATARLKDLERARNISLLVAIHYQLERECRLVVIGCQLEFCKNLVTIRRPIAEVYRRRCGERGFSRPRSHPPQGRKRTRTVGSSCAKSGSRPPRLTLAA